MPEEVCNGIDDDSDAEDIFALSACEESGLEEAYKEVFLYRWQRAVTELCRLLRSDVLLPLHPDFGDAGVVWKRVDEAVVLPSWHCAFLGCAAASSGWHESSSHKDGLWTLN